MEYRRKVEVKEPMVPAVDVDGLAYNLIQVEGLAIEDKGVYIDSLYADKLITLRERFLARGDSTRTEFVSGQIGAGKSTAFAFFADVRIRAQFEVLHFTPREDMDVNTWDDPEVNVIEILIHIGESLLQEARRRGAEQYIVDHVELFFEIAKNVQQTLQIETITSGTQVQQWTDMVFKFFTRMNLERNYKKVIREQYKNRDLDLIEAIDHMIFDFERKVAKKPLLLIIDDWEKLQKPTALRNVFEHGMPFLKRLRCAKLIPIPVHLRALRIGKDLYSNTIDFIIKIRPNPLILKVVEEENEESAIILNGRNAIKQVLQARIDPNHRDELVEAKAIDRAIEMSGGIIRQFLKIMAEAAARARTAQSPVVRIEHVNAAIKLMSGNMSMGVVFDGSMVRLLEQIRTENQPSENAEHELIIEAFVNLFVYLNMNGFPCFHVNPLVEETVRVYARPRQSES